MRDEQPEPAARDQSSVETVCALQELARDWEFLFGAFLVFGVGRLVWMYCVRPENSGFHLGVSCGFVLSGVFGFAMRWILNPTENRERKK